MINLLGSSTRRQFLRGAAVTATSCILPVAAFPDGSPKENSLLLEAKPGKANLREKGSKPTDIWGYGGQAPGPVIRSQQGGTLKVSFKNSLNQASTVHWHGIRIDNKMDGVAGLTQNAVAPGETFNYEFLLPDAGTFWYHPHNRSWEQMGRGLYGLLIVDEKQPYPVDHDIALALDDWQLVNDGELEDSYGNIAERARLGRVGNTMTVNGAPDQKIQVVSGDRARIRLCNTANARIMTLKVKDSRAHIIALDGQPVNPYEPTDGVFVLGPSQRADLIIDFGTQSESSIVLADASQQPLVHFIHKKNRENIVNKSLGKLPLNPLSKPDFKNIEKVAINLFGGKGSYLESARVYGKEYSLNELANQFGYMWSLNGDAGIPEKPLFSVKRGQTVELEFVNQTIWAHAMHLHGHHTQEINRTGKNKPGNSLYTSTSHWRDTVLVDAHEILKVVFVADNPGKWMLHCHMLEHQAGGMTSWFEVT